ncbi:MAG: exonuclease domain-containing protein [Clostridia bacterium]|nr:exonuclease domain-containing protein [Clostridia bacterium]
MVGMIKAILLSNVFNLNKPQEECLLIPPPPLIQRLKYLTGLAKNCVSHKQRLDQTRFVIFDTETTGLHPYAGDEIISISGIVLKNGQIDTINYFDRYVNPCRPIPPLATEITGITQDQVQGEPDIFHVLADFLKFVGDGVLVAHNSDFDLNFINLKLKRFCQTKIIHPTVDTLSLSYALKPTLKNHTLDYLANFYNIPINQRHTSLGDSVITAQLFHRFLNILKERGVYTIRDLQNYLHFRAVL